MNQQRSRRFQSAREAKEEAEKKAEFQKLLVSTGQAAPETTSQPPEPKFDSNVITPGTPFMHFLSEALKYWVAYKLNTDPGWAKLKIIISDSSVPGEGEHKMMEFIRSQRRSQEHDPNTQHVIYGLDADLIFLGLATHEPHFRILREDVFFDDKKRKTCNTCGQTGHQSFQCRGDEKKMEGVYDEKDYHDGKKPYIWLHLSILREYLEIHLRNPKQGFKFDLERAIDDYVFLCFFVGNDFLPHLPSLGIREEGIDILVSIWKENLPLYGGYITTDGVVDLEKAQYVLDGLAKQEDSIFKKRREVALKRAEGAKRRRLDNPRNGEGGNNTPTGNGGLNRGGSRRGKREENFDDVITFSPAEANSRSVREQAQELYINRKEIFQAQVTDANMANKSAAAILKETLLRRKSGTVDVSPVNNEDGASEAVPDTPPSAIAKRKADVLEEDEEGTPGRSTPVSNTRVVDPDEPPPDDIRMWEEGYAERYYERKFHVDPKDLEFRHKVAGAYVEGVCWVLLYYMQGCPSWTWFYPYHYAPFAADFVEMKRWQPTFQKGKPFHPYEQLMGVLPAASNHAIPESFRSLMSDPDSDIIDFYPEDFVLDLNGKKFAWQGVALLPFIDEKRLLAAMATRYPFLSEDEHLRNARGRDIMLFSRSHPLYQDVLSNFYSKKQGASDFKLNPRNSDGLSGKVEKVESFLPQGPLSSPLEVIELPGVVEDTSMR
jgi:5'-3' exoribonuclease 2